MPLIFMRLCLRQNEYVRHDADMVFYLTERERKLIDVSMDEVLKFAFAFVFVFVFVLERSRRLVR
jgi:hypothetical protein